MPGIQRVRKPEASVSQLDIKACRETVKLFNELFHSCLGPQGKIKFIQNCVGGHLTITSSSGRLLAAISVHNPVLKFITSAIQSHLSIYGDGGLYFASLSSSLVYKGLESNISGKLLTEIFEFLLTRSLEYLNAESCIYRYHVDLSDINFMTAFLRSILKTKPLCRLSEDDIKYLTVLLLECFLNSVNEKETCAPSDNVYIIVSETEKVKCSKKFPGILLHAPELSRYNEDVEMSVKTVVQNGQHCIKLVLINASLSGDLEELGDLKLRTEGDLDVESGVLDHLASVVESWVEAGVGLVLCQKVVHPRLKKLLQTHNIVVVDRIGLQPIGFLSKLSGAAPISCLDGEVPASQYGWLTKVRHTVVYNKSYLQLQKGDNSVLTTLMLTHRQEQVLTEVKTLCQTALTSLDRLLTVPYVLCGGGCWQAGLVHHLQHVILENIDDLAESLEISKLCLHEASQLYIDSILHSSVHHKTETVYNSTQGHLYIRSRTDRCTDGVRVGTTQCCCGLMELDTTDKLIEINCRDRVNPALISDLKSCSDGCHDNVKPNDAEAHRNEQQGCKKVPKTPNVLWDSLSVRRNALQMSVLTACAALRIGQVMDNY